MIVKQLVALLGFQTDDASAKKAEGQLSNIIEFAKKAAVAFAGIKLIGTFKGMAEQVAQVGDKFDKMALRTGMSSQELQKWGHAAELSGASIEAIEGSTRKLSMSMGMAADGSKEAVEGFKKLGVNIRNADGSMKSVDQLLPEMADGFAGMTSDTDRTETAMRLLGKQGTMLLPLLKQGSSAVEDQRKEFEELGGVIDDDLKKASTDYLDNQTRVKAGMLGLKNIVAKALLPAMNNMLVATIKWIKANREWIAQKVGPILKSIADAFATIKRFLVDMVDGAINWVKNLSPIGKTIMKITGAILAVLALLALPLGPIIAIAAAIMLVVEDFQVWREGGVSVIGALIDWFKKLLSAFPALRAAITAIAGIFKGAFMVMREAFFAFLKFFVDWWEVGFVEAIKRFGKSVAAIFRMIWDGIGEHIKAAGQFWLDLITGFFSTLWGWITGAVKAIGDAIVGIFQYAYDSVAMVLNSIYNAIVNAFTMAASAVGSVLSAAWDGVVAGFKWLWDSIVQMASFYVDLILAPFRGMMALWNALWTDGLDGVLSLLKSWAGTAIDAVLAPFKKVKEWIGKLFGGGKAAEMEVGITRTEKAAPGAPGAALAPGVAPAPSGAMLVARGISNVAQAGPTAFAPSYVQATPARGPISIAPQTKVDVQVAAAPGMNEAQLAQQVAKQVEAAIETQNRLAIQSLTPAAAGAR
jgi:hypothetical protein